jgi:hypothetical protein
MRQEAVQSLARYIVMHGRLHGKASGDVLWELFQSARPKFVLMAELWAEIQSVKNAETQTKQEVLR